MALLLLLIGVAVAIHQQKMDIMTSLKIIFVILLAIPVLILTFSLTGKLMDELIDKTRSRR